MKVYALVGSSGTGKSYRALELACEKNIKYIIDDGILIHKNKILAGVSAKQAGTKIEAVKRAIFNDLKHRENVQTKIVEESIDKILIIGTSDKMVNQIANKLKLGKIDEVIYIQDISTQEDIKKAKESRSKGNHVIPVPTVEVKSMGSGFIINSIKRLFRRDNKPDVVMEKTIIRPVFNYMGKIYINKDVIHQVIVYELSKFDYISKINSIKIEEKEKVFTVLVTIEVNFFKNIGEIVEIQKHIIKCLSEITLINLAKIDIYINKIRNVKK